MHSPVESRIVGAFDQLEDFRHLLHSLAGQLLMYSIQIGSTLCPEVNLSQGTRMCVWLLQQETHFDQSGNHNKAGQS